MASSSSSQQQNKDSNSSSGIEPLRIRRKVSESSTLFDVFINHRGPDVKQTLATQFYDSLEKLGIRAFLDSREKELGNSFPSTIETAIRSAKVHIAIFSERYAESAWCLDELLLMLESRAKIIPVFYQVKPSDLRHIEKGAYAKAFIEHEEKGRYNEEKLKAWKEALWSLSLIAGEEFNSEWDCQKIVAAVQKEVERKTCLHVAEYPVGLSNLVEDFEKRCLDKLVQDFENQCGPEEGNLHAKVVGIFGMGGSGKTTLAKELFNRKKSNYTTASFLFDVREASVRSELPSLQSKLLKDLFGTEISFRRKEEGTSSLKDYLSRAPTLSSLIVVDDIDQVDQLNALRVMDFLNKSGNSLVIVTTRDVGVLLSAGITVFYNIKGMDRKDATELFCWHAFGQRDPCNGYEVLVDSFVEVCVGLPLSLQVLGRHVRGRDHRFWESELIKARMMVPQHVKQKLKISIDALDDEEKQVFMDIACFFVGKQTSIAERILEGSGWNARNVMERLKDKCLLEKGEIQSLDDKGTVLRMHDHLRDLAREMALTLSPPHRLWRPKDLKSFESMDFKTILDKANIRCFHSIFDESMGSQVTFFLGQPDTCFEKSKTNIGTNIGCFHSVFKSMGSLVKLFSDQPDTCFKISASLLWLQLEGISTEQRSIPTWIPLQNLRCLKINCAGLKTLWKNNVQAPSQLKELEICKSLGNFPDLAQSECSALEELRLEHLSSLEKICIQNCYSLKRMLRISNHASLVELEINNCWRGKGNLSLSSMKCLERITFRKEALKYFRLDGCPKLKSVRGLDCYWLVELSIRDCPELEEFPASICPSNCLERIIIDGCGKLKHFELLGCNELKNVSGKSPELEWSQCSAVLSGFEHLRINSCDKLQNITPPTTLISLFVQSCRDLKRISGIADLMNLTELIISQCPELEGLPIFSRLNCLEHLTIDSCEKLKNITLPTTTIFSLSIKSCRCLQRVAGIGDLPKLTELTIKECPELEELPSLARLSCLEQIEIDTCEKLQNITGIEELHASEYIGLCYCSNALIRNCIHGLERVPSKGFDMIGRAVEGAESSLKDHLFCNIKIGIDGVSEIGTHNSYPEWSELSAVIGCFVVVVDSSTSVEDINEPLQSYGYGYGYDHEYSSMMRDGKWIITLVACDDERYFYLKEVENVFSRKGILKKSFGAGVKKGEEWKIVGVLGAIVDKLHHS